MKPCIQIRVDQTAGKRAPAVGTAAAGRTAGSAALSKPTNIQLNGAWAFYESRHQEDNETIRSLERRVQALEDKNSQLENSLQEAHAQLSAQQTQAAVSENERQSLDARLKDLHISHRTLQSTSARDLNRMGSELAALRAQNESLRTQTAQSQQESHEARTALMASSEDLAQSQALEKQLVERLEAAETAAAEATGRASALSRDNKTLLRQRDHHISHAELLMKEKNRYFAMMQDVKRAGAQSAALIDSSRRSPTKQKPKSTGPGQANSGTPGHNMKAKPASSKKSRNAMSCVKAGSSAFTAADAIREAQKLRCRSASSTPIKIHHRVIGEGSPVSSLITIPTSPS